ncbi:MAG: DHH family phosphoesterase [Lachnospiraceae bacterium]|nr:DHH family phosphoesterase [Lachnospiraceae bacterium]
MDKKKQNVVNTYLRWPFLAGIVLALAAAGAYFYDVRIGLFLTAVVLAYYLAALIIAILNKKVYLRRLTDFGAAFAHVQNQMLRDMKVPFALAAPDGEVVWYNQAFLETFGLMKQRIMLFHIFPEMEKADIRKYDKKALKYGDCTYRLFVHSLDITDAEEVLETASSGARKLFSIYLLDETDEVFYRQSLEEEKNVVGLIYIDNYEEIMAGIEEVRRSLLSAMLERKLNRYAENVSGVLKKLEKDRFLLFMTQKGLWKMQEANFDLLEDIKTVNIGNEMTATLSIGIGLNGETAAANYDMARASIDMALGRGGDQAVVQNGEDISYYGGKSKSTERNTRVKARMKAESLKDLINAAEDVMIMGHPISDLDCLGAAVGIYRMARFSGKRARIVMGAVTNSMKPLMARFRESGEYEEDLFIDRETALKTFKPATLLVVVDTNRPSYTECPDLLNRAERIVVMDHHRQGKERIDNATLSYVEPFASSASEMVAEVVQYYDPAIKLHALEADAVLSGIVMDTNNFVDKAGVRTFEAAAYLRRNNADVTRVRKLFRDNMDDYKLRAETVHRAEIFRQHYIISVCPDEAGNKNQTVVAAQAANELLEIDGVKASFVLTNFEGKIYLSARSIDEVNVQVLMEKMGGGGHMSVAGAQFTDKTIDEVIAWLKEVIVDSEKE